MKRIAIVIALLAFGSRYADALNFYVDPGYGKVRYADIIKPEQPYKLKLKVEFQRNARHLPKVDGVILKIVDRVIRASGFAIPVPDGDPGPDGLTIVLNDVVDMGKAVAKGVVTGMTLGLKGSTGADHYEMQVTAAIAGRTIAKSGYKHAIYTTVGLAKAPQGLPPLTAAKAIEKVVEELILNFLGDLQTEINPPGGAVLPGAAAQPAAPVPPTSGLH
jgi:hypothetical protein